MKVKLEECNRVSILRFQGDLTIRERFRPTIARFMERQDHRIVLELSGVEMIGSADLSDLIELTARSNMRGGKIVLASPSPFVEGVLRSTKLDNYFEVYDDVEAALCAMEESRDGRNG